MFNNCGLPLNEAQKLQKKCSRKVENIEHDNEEDIALIEKYFSGDDSAGMELLTNYSDMVSYIYKYPHKAQYKTKSKANVDWTPQEKECLFQEIAYQFFRLVEEYDEKQGDFEGLIKGKLHLRVYDNFFEDIVDQKFNEVSYDEDIDFMQKVKNAFNNESKPEEYLHLYNALDELTKRQREILLRSKIDGWNSSEIAEDIGISESSVRSHLQIAIKKLDSLLEGG